MDQLDIAVLPYSLLRFAFSRLLISPRFAIYSALLINSISDNVDCCTWSFSYGRCFYCFALLAKEYFSRFTALGV